MIRAKTSQDLLALPQLPKAASSLQRAPSLDSFTRAYGDAPARAPHAAPLIPLHNPVLMAVLTGGPCGGKTTLLDGNAQEGVPNLMDALAARGVAATVVTEAAAEEIEANGLPLEGPGGLIGFNQRLIQRQISKQDAGKRAAEATAHGRSLVVCDRGAPDSLAFLDSHQLEQLRGNLGQQQAVLDPRQFDAVVHLVTAAYGAEAAYRWMNSKTDAVAYRSNPPEEAQKLDDRLRAAYAANPQQHVLTNAGFDAQAPSRSYAAKRQAALDALEALVNAQEPEMVARQRHLALQDLHRLAPVFNIEGVSAAQVAKQQCLLDKPPLWLAAHVVLDTPLHGKRETYDAIRQRTAHLKLKESGIPGFNHRRAKLACLSMVGWAIENVHREQGKAPGERAVVTVKIHRTSPLAPVICGLLAAAYPGSEPVPHPTSPLLDGLFIPQHKVEVQFRAAPVAGRELDYDLGKTSFAKSDAVVSLGLVGSLSADYPPGTLVLTDKFIPMPVDSRTLDWSQAQSAHNLAVDKQADIVALAESHRWADRIAQEPAFASPYEEGPTAQVEPVSALSFQHVPLALQVDKLYSPTNGKERLHLWGR